MSEISGISENAYGHAKRLRWLVSRIEKNESVVELGCGTGVMICAPLLEAGYDVAGVDRDADSIELGRRMFGERGLDPERLSSKDISELEGKVDVVVVSEVLEHLPEPDLKALLGGVMEKLKPGGRLLVTVPNGYGWFELESFLWFRLGLGGLIERLGIMKVVMKLKRTLLGKDFVDPFPSSLDDSGHVRRFTLSSIRRLLADTGFQFSDHTGSVLFAGPFSNLFFTGVKPVMKLNCLLGKWFPRIASGFFVASRR